jgi:type IV pilus assembly protein PilQ
MSGLKVVFLSLLFLFMIVKNSAIFAVSNSAQQVSINFANIKTRDLLLLLTKVSGKSIVIDEKIKSRISVNLRKASLREALDIVLQMQGLVKRETANAIIIAPISKLDKKESLLLRPAVFDLHHTSAVNISKIVGPAGVLSPSGKAGAEARTNMLMVSDTPDKIRELKKVLEQIDVPSKQVLIEARIVSVDEKFASDLGLEFRVGQPKEAGRSDSDPAAFGFRRGSFNFAIAKLNNSSLLDLELAALESEGRGRVISSPKLLTADRQAAYIESGAEIPYQEKTKEGDTSTSFKKAVL